MRHIFLIGLPGSGKSTVGRCLAQRLGKPLFDIDALIEAECAESIAAIFALHGEDYFRVCESRVLAEVTQEVESAVIVTGGGIVVREENRALMAERGIRIHLQVEPQEALERLRSQQAMALTQGMIPEVRPLLSGPSPLASLLTLLATRNGWYDEAELSCSTQGKDIEQVAQEIMAMLNGSGSFAEGQPIVQHVQVDQGYDTVVDWGGIGRLPQYLSRLALPPRVFLITDSNVQKLYLPTVMQNLTAAGFDPYLYVVPAGEGSKSFSQLQAIYNWLVEMHAERREAIIAFGGGVVGDLVGFVAATYLRGVPLVHIPTSLLAQVDSAIGGKTGINHPRGKNLIGAFYHPRLVLVDPSALLTLPVRERTEGWAEVVKYGIILDTELFALLEAQADALRSFDHPPVDLLCQIIARCIELKVNVIEDDEKERGRRAILNYGHTIGHALENASGYGELLHGEAVSLGMSAAARLAVAAGYWSSDDARRQNRVLAALGLPIVYSGTVRAQEIMTTMQLDKKVVGKRVHWIMPRRIGEVMITELPDELVERVIAEFFSGKKR